jgi:hypothetical protein
MMHRHELVRAKGYRFRKASGLLLEWKAKSRESSRMGHDGQRFVMIKESSGSARPAEPFVVVVDLAQDARARFTRFRVARWTLTV